MQQIALTTRDAVSIVSPAGLIDTRTSQAFESTMVQAFSGGARAFAVDFSRVDLITSAGIRVLVMMAHRLQRGDGGLVLFALGDRVRTVFEIGGLLQQFRIVGTEQEAVAALSQPKPARTKEPARTSRLTGLVYDLVCAEALHQGPGRPAPDVAASALTTAVSRAVDGWSPPGGSGSAGSDRR